MRTKKLMNDSFYSNNEPFSGITAVESLSTDLFFHYIKNTSGHWKLSGNTATLASGIIFEDSVTTSIVVTPSTIIKYSGVTQQLSVVNQDGVNVITECLFTSSNSGASVSSGGLVTVILTGSTTITATHNDGPTGSSVVTGYWPGPVTLSPLATTGITGTTLQYNLITIGGHDITSDSTWTCVISGTSTPSTGVTIDSDGLATITETAPNGLIVTITATYALATGTPYQPSTQLTVIAAPA